MSNNKKTQLTEEDLEVLKKLKIMMSKKGISREELEKDCFYSHPRVKSYFEGQRRIPEKVVREISDFYNLNYNWFYGKAQFMDEIDANVHNLFLLNKVFRMRIVPNRFVRDGNSYDISSMALRFDQRYVNYIADIYALEREQNNPNSPFSEEDYARKRKEIFSKHEKYLREIFELDNFIEAESIAVDSAEDISFTEILNSVYDNTQEDK